MGDINSEEHSLQKTPLYEEHVILGAKMVPFGGWNMPVQYTNVIDEHITTRTKAGIFDICHMGEFEIKGRDALALLQKVCTNDVAKLADGQCQYNVICNEQGGAIDDCFVYRIAATHFMLVVNAGTIAKDFAWLKKHGLGLEGSVVDLSQATAKLDLQGPCAEQILQHLLLNDLSKLSRFHFFQDTLYYKDLKVACLISRTGYTGEDGFEIYFDAAVASPVWRALLAMGRPYGLKPIGLGARDTLRLEACYSLYGHELSEEITPVEASIGWVVRLQKGEFIGKPVLAQQKENGPMRINVAFEMQDRSIAREHYPVFKEGKQIGVVSSGTFSPTLKKPIGMALIAAEHKEPGTIIEINIRDQMRPALIVKKPFYAYKGGV